MNFTSQIPVFAVAAGISFSALGASSTPSGLSEARMAGIRTSVESAKLVEAPYRAAHLVLAARKEDRAAVARAAVEAVLAKHPTAVASTVRAVLTVAPEQVQAVLEAVMAQTPKAFKTALAVIGEMDQSALGLAVKTVGSLSPGDLATAQTFAAQFEPTKGGEVGLAKAGGKNLGPSQQSSVVAQKKVAENRLNP